MEVTYTNFDSHDDLIATYNKIKDIVEPHKRKYDKEMDDKMIKKIQTEFPQFFKSFYYVVQHMVYNGQASTSAFQKYLQKIKIAHFKNAEEFHDAISTYLTLVYVENNPRNRGRLAAEFKKEAFRQLQDDHKKFLDDYDQAEKIQEQNKKDILQKRKQRIYDTLSGSDLS
uniref:Uncharacterized protein n=1 Tax=Abalone asfa-like virus TaxID=2839893 RepID=A0A5K7XZD4_9VIRU|nr:hypothetical protein [Abalone asfa-like virus]BCY04633.1 hypothetical protein [Abalone asfa-like virus]